LRTGIGRLLAGRRGGGIGAGGHAVDPLCLMMGVMERHEHERADVSALWSIGHSTRPLDELVAMLHEAGVVVLADVRRYPGSRRPRSGSPPCPTWAAGAQRGPTPPTPHGATPASAAMPTTWTPPATSARAIGSRRSPANTAPRSCAPRPPGGAATAA